MIRVAVIDDSSTMRALLTARLEAAGDISVVGSAADAAEGRVLIKRLNPDVVTLDIEMPGMNGLDFLEKLMRLRPTPVIIASGATKHGSDATVSALALGAVGCYAKIDGMVGDDNGRLVRLVREAAQARFGPGVRATAPCTGTMPASTSPALADEPSLIGVGSSTGGVEALRVLLSEFPADCPPTLIVQHVDAKFAPAIAKTLNSASPAQVQLATPSMRLERGNVYLAPSDERHLEVGGEAPYYIKLRKRDLISNHRPSVDALFCSIAQTVGKAASGVLLTGMGHDGARGLLAMARSGAHTVAQDEASCTVFGMPRRAIEIGAARAVLPLRDITAHLFNRRRSGGPERTREAGGNRMSTPDHAVMTNPDQATTSRATR